MESHFEDAEKRTKYTRILMNDDENTTTEELSAQCLYGGFTLHINSFCDCTYEAQGFSKKKISPLSLWRH